MAEERKTSFRHCLPLALLFLPFSSSFLPGQGGWVQLHPAASPPARAGHAMAYDSARGKVVLFGGSDYGSSNRKTRYLSDTWEWDGKNWTQLHPTTSPHARSEHAMAYDSARGKVVLFGGYYYDYNNLKSYYLSDTWEWDGKNWIKMQLSTSPSARREHAMVYDSARRKVVLFGGFYYDYSGGKSYYFSDTWELDGKNWTQIHPITSPPYRWRHAMACDFGQGKVSMFGGLGKGGLLSDTWEWDGKNWARIHLTKIPPARLAHTMAYDSVSGWMVLFGGNCVGGYLGDTWGKRRHNWVNFPFISSPSARYDHAMTYDSRMGYTLLFGGYGSFNGKQSYLSDTWKLTLNPKASFVSFGRGCTGSNKLVPLLRAKNLPCLGGTLVLELKNSPIMTWTFLSLGLQTVNFSLAPYGAPGCTLYNNLDFVFPNSTNLTGAWSLPHQFRIPADVNLLGGTIPMQVLLADKPANPLGITVSNAAKATIGF